MSVSSRTDDQAEPTATVRGEIDRGETGEKVAGFDPATVPLETDAEAGGAPTHGASQPVPPRSTSLPNANASDHGTAMRPFDDAAKPNKSVVPLMTYAIGVVVALLVIVAVASMLG
ncbi:hypothetical protein [Tianweitania sediminis]|uniref:Uncharacterized protein n=1 Tax=Tianweitania sediminis TaxID=1502156 RepID=A0A8J7UL98_9HYPH|nr:hypothetical protein [Tianweitania sediminis]MBP0440715.1 hypothetical protein [Tianweitania sediminis]